MGDLTAHFSKDEFRCHHCQRLRGPELALLWVLEDLRKETGGAPLRIVSGYRCPTHNRRVGGAGRSQHLYGRAADLLPGRFTVAQAIASSANGVGHNSDGWVTHVDVRPGRRVIWEYT